MAKKKEAHSHAAMQSLKSGVFVVSDDAGYHMRLDITIPSRMVLRRMMYRTVVRTVRNVRNFFFPLGAPFAVATAVVLVPTVISRPSDSWFRSGFIANAAWSFGMKVIPGFRTLPWKVQVGTLALGCGVVGMGVIAYMNRYLLRIVLSYHGYMFEGRRVSLKTKLFFAWMRWQQILNGKRGPALYSWQKSIPRLPVPALAKTCERYLQSIHSLVPPEEYAEVQMTAKRFLHEEGPRLQRWLIAKSWVSPNYVSDWWEKYVYLLGREPIMINSNYYVLDSGGPPASTLQCSRAAGLVWMYLRFKRRLEAEDPLMELQYPPWFCMWQYERMFSTTRIPGVECDSIRHWEEPESRHIAVLRRGIWYVLPVVHPDNSMLERCELEQQLEAIVAAADGIDAGRFGSKPTKAEALIAALTAGDRTHWANTREQFFKSGINRTSLHLIESSIFCLILDHELPEDENGRARALMHGSGANRWFDKSITMVVFPDGNSGLNCEHSWADAPVIGHLSETAVMSNFGEMCLCELDKTGVHANCSRTRGCKVRMFDEEGRCIKTGIYAKGQERRLPPYMRITWDLPEEAETAIFTAHARALSLIGDLDLRICCFADYGKGFIKDQNMGPDGYVQMALQLAYRLTHNKPVLTYESTMTRMFRNGRTETVRPATDESDAFVRGMMDPTSTKEQRIRLLRSAVSVHVHNTRLCMTGEGIDRHLFALYVVAKGTNTESKFLKDALSKPWVLSTSQQPQCQTDLWDPKLQPERISAGGGFGPVTDHGYGCSYQVMEDQLYFHVSSKKSSVESDSDRFISNLFQALRDMSALFKKADK